MNAPSPKLVDLAGTIAQSVGGRVEVVEMPAIREQLVLSAKTIGAHLRNIYANLGVHFRVELASRIHRDSGSAAG